MGVMEGGNVPKHVAVILDGNRRFSEKMGMPKLKGHERGFDKIKELLEWCMDAGVKEVTLYCFSTENFKRSKEEVGYLFNLFRKRISEFKDDKVVHDKRVRIKVVGRVEMFPSDMQEKMKEVMEKTKGYDGYRLNLALGYGGRQEIIDACNKLVSKGKEVDEEGFRKELYLSSYPDLLIRPGGEKRISNFLLWQTAYSEIVWVSKLWPEFTKEDFIACLEEYKRRERRFGK